MSASVEILDARPLTILAESEWTARQRAHVARVRHWTEPHRTRAARGERHPVYDFLWDYFSLRPGLLERWHPGFGVGLDGASARAFLKQPGYAQTPCGVTATTATLSAARRAAIQWIGALLRACAERPAFYGCFGLHEWAMVHRTPEVRHASIPLRFQPDALACIVESLPVRCSHFDAFRFFTPSARPLNRLQPTSDTRPELEQRGCVHVTMDLYKWAYKLSPFVPSELVADCFELALVARELDMRASPYDLAGLGFAPVKIETPEGRAEYEREQRRLSEQAGPLRQRLLKVCERMLAAPVEPQA